MKKALLILIMIMTTAMVMGANPVTAAVQNSYEVTAIELEIDGTLVSLTDPIIVTDGRSMLPMRSLFETLGATVTWDDAEQIASAQREDNMVAFPINSNTISVNGETVTVDVPALLIGDTTYVPVRAAAESLGYSVNWIGGRTISLFTQTVRKSLVPKIDLMQYVGTWTSEDRADLIAILPNAKAKPTDLRAAIYDQYVELNHAFTQLQNEVYTSKRGYSIYTPAQSDIFNNLWVAINARSLLLADMMSGNVGGIDRYYPGNSRYNVFRYGSSDIQPRETFTGFNLELMISMLDELAIDDYFLHGMKIFAVNGAMADTTAGFNTNSSVRGFSDAHIVLFNYGQDSTKLLSTLAHEIGHSVGFEIFNSYEGSSLTKVQKNTAARQAYAALYGETEKATADWHTSLDENFADDFASLMVGKKKQATWGNGRSPDFEPFLAKHLAAINYGAITVTRGVHVATANNDALYAMSDFMRYPAVLVTNNNRIRVVVDGLKSADELMILLTGSGTFDYVPVKDGVAEIYLPNDHSFYQIMIGQQNPVSQRPTGYFVTLTVLYADITSDRYTNAAFEANPDPNFTNRILFGH